MKSFNPDTTTQPFTARYLNKRITESRLNTVIPDLRPSPHIVDNHMIIGFYIASMSPERVVGAEGWPEH